MNTRLSRLPLAIAALLLTVAPAAAQDTGKRLEGDWAGVIDVGKSRLHLEMHVTPAPEGLPNVTVVSLDQGNEQLPGRVMETKGPEAQMLFLADGATYDATLSADGRTLSGRWSQGGANLPLAFTRTDGASAKH